MRLLFLLISSSLLVACSSSNKLDGIYFTRQQDCMVFNGDESIIENKKDYTVGNLIVKETDEYLKFRTPALNIWIRFFSRQMRRYRFKYLYKSQDSFMVSPRSKAAKQYFKNRDSIVFIAKTMFADKTNSFDKIIFHSSHCFGCCSDLHLEVDWSGNLKVTDNGRGWSKGCSDSILNNNYYGKVSFADMERLKKAMVYSQLKTLDWPKERSCFDAPDVTLIVCQNYKRYYFKINQPCLPVVSWQLANILHSFFFYETLKKSDTTFIYEQ